MRLDKIIWRAVWKTLLAAAALIAAMLLLLISLFPHTLMDFTDSLGMDKLSVKFAVTSYERFEKIDYIANGARVALRANLYDEADECIELLIADDGFQAYCDAKDAEAGALLPGEGYRNYYYRQLCLAKYLSGEKTGAVDRAVQLTAQSFSVGNPLISVIAQARADGDDGRATMVYVYEKMTVVRAGVYENYSVQDQAEFDRVYATVTAWTQTA